MKSQWLRKCSLLVSGAGQTMDLSDLRVTFQVRMASVESPDHAEIRVLNLSPATSVAIQREFTQVVLSAGYETGNFGLLFTGTIKQFRAGRLPDGVTTYLDILAADGDVFYNRSLTSLSLAAGTDPKQAITNLAAAAGFGSDFSALMVTESNVPSLRGQAFFGLARARLRNLATHLDASWSVRGGKIVVASNKGYAAGQVVSLTRETGLIGTPEQTPGGITATCLINSRLRVGGQVRLAPDAINITRQSAASAAPVSYDSYDLYNMAATRDDGLYRIYAIDHTGDTRGDVWHSQLTLLALDPTQEPAG